MGFMMPMDGYGIATVKIGDLLAGRGWRVVDMRDEKTGGYGTTETEMRWWDVDGPTLAMCVPDWLNHFDGPAPVVNFTMFESSRLPKNRVEVLNWRSSGCIVTCGWCRDVFVESGVRVPIRVAPLGVDGRDFPRLERGENTGDREGRPYTFLWSGTPDRRKGWDLAYRCFVKAFGKREDVQLVLHWREKPRGLSGVGDPNVQMVEGRVDHAALLDLLSQADCFVFPSRGEGWGQPPREAAMTGLPAIATDWSGLSVGLAEWGLPLRVRWMSPAEFGWWQYEDLGEWAEPDPDHLIELMRWCEGHRVEAAAHGMRAAAWLRSHATWEQTAEAVVRAWDEIREA